MIQQELLEIIKQAAAEGWEELDLSDKGLTELPPEIGQLTKLKSLNLRSSRSWEEGYKNRNQLTALPPEIWQLTTLTDLDLSGNQLTALPSEIGNLTNLTDLILSHNQLTAFPPEIGKLTNLTSLNLSYNHLTVLPPEIGNLTNLIELWLGDNRLIALPPEIGQLKNLKNLNLNQNQLATLPSEISNLTNLTTIWLSGNQLTMTTLPQELLALKNLAVIALGHYQLTTLPPELFTLTDLTYLSLIHNQLTMLPSELFTLTNLEILALHENQLNILSPEISKLTNLKRLELPDNQLITLPPELGQLIKLERLNLRANQLITLPPELSQLTKLEELFLDDNPLISPPLEIIEQGTQSILAFLREQAQGCSQQWLSKLIVVGEGGVGKTSLLRALNGEPFVEGLETTHGIRIETIELPHPTEPDVMMQLNAWDFGGQEIYHATHQFFLTNRSLFILAWNARHGYEQGKIFYWLDQIQARAPESPVLVVATHLDERDADLPKEELLAKYPQIAGFYELSNKSGKGIAEIRKALTDAAAKLPLMGQKWPTNWLNAAETIRAKEEKHITPQQLLNIMEAEGVSSKQVLARWLHELGDILYFAEDEELNDLVILKPEWVAAYISKVLESDEVIERDGIFTREHERHLWGDLDPEMQDHFLRLMEKFDLSYRTLENREISLVVERLPLDPPEYEELWESPKSIEPCREIALTYKLSTLPAGIPTWFIARTHRFTTHTHWRTGAIFGDDRKQPKHLALVRASAHDRCLKLTVRGPNPHNFFTLLKDGIELTLDRFPGLKIQRLMPCPGHDSEPCEYEFNYAHLQKAIEKNPPIQEIQCPVAFEMVSVPGLLFGLHWNTQDAVLERIDTLETKVVDKQDAILEELYNLRELTQREFLNIFRREQAKIESECPNVFILRPYRASKWKETLVGKTIYLKLCCQVPGQWHLTAKGGLYELTPSAEWLAKFTPYVKKFVGVLKYAAPMVGPWLNRDFEEYAQEFKNDLSLMNELVKKLPDVKADRELGLTKGMGDDIFAERVSHEASGAALRALREVLEEKDPQHDWGGLKKVLTPEGHYLWLCEHHAQEYAI